MHEPAGHADHHQDTRWRVGANAAWRTVNRQWVQTFIESMQLFVDSVCKLNQMQIQSAQSTVNANSIGSECKFNRQWMPQTLTRAQVGEILKVHDPKNEFSFVCQNLSLNSSCVCNFYQNSLTRFPFIFHYELPEPWQIHEKSAPLFHLSIGSECLKLWHVLNKQVGEILKGHEAFNKKLQVLFVKICH